MSTTRTPSSLKWLINKRARIHGEISKIELLQQERIKIAEQRLQLVEQELESARRFLHFERDVTDLQLKKLKTNLQTIDATLALHEILIDPKIISPIRPREARTALPYGKITRLIFEYLGASNGVPITTTEFAIFISRRENMNLDKTQFSDFKMIVAHRLRNLMDKEKVVRLKNEEGSIERKWILPLK